MDYCSVNERKTVFHYMRLQKKFPNVTKYMGSKTEVLDLIEEGFKYMDRNYTWVCDLFSGSATLAGALRNRSNVISNDVQKYSSVFAETYLSNYDWKKYPSVIEIANKAKAMYDQIMTAYPEYAERFNYHKDFTLEEFNAVESEARALIKRNDWSYFNGYCLFTKDYSGTYWSYKQCVAIDAYRCVIDSYKDQPEFYNLLLTCLMYAMAYNSQSTGHYAQYRIPNNDKSKEDILIYRRKTITEFFVRKYNELKNFLSDNNAYSFQSLSLTDDECLKEIPERTLVYADPPYCFVHYSRFYHTLETLVDYDYPTVQFKGRYRDDRYQSDFCIRSKVADAFYKMFTGIRDKKSDMMLSYTNSNTNTIDFAKLLDTCFRAFNHEVYDAEKVKYEIDKCRSFFDGENANNTIALMSKNEYGDDLEYEIAMIKKPYNHSRMGRTKSKTIPVTEVIILAKYLK